MEQALMSLLHESAWCGFRLAVTVATFFTSM